MDQGPVSNDQRSINARINDNFRFKYCSFHVWYTVFIYVYAHVFLLLLVFDICDYTCWFKIIMLLRLFGPSNPMKFDDSSVLTRFFVWRSPQQRFSLLRSHVQRWLHFLHHIPPCTNGIKLHLERWWINHTSHAKCLRTSDHVNHVESRSFDETSAEWRQCWSQNHDWSSLLKTRNHWTVIVLEFLSVSMNVIAWKGVAELLLSFIKDLEAGETVARESMPGTRNYCHDGQTELPRKNWKGSTPWLTIDSTMTVILNRVEPSSPWFAHMKMWLNRHWQEWPSTEKSGASTFHSKTWCVVTRVSGIP